MRFKLSLDERVKVDIDFGVEFYSFYILMEIISNKILMNNYYDAT